MPVIEREPITRPVCRGDEWVSVACEQFSRATGWPLRFVAARRRGERPEQPNIDSECWSVEVRDRQKLCGRLSLGQPDDDASAHSFAAACEMAELVAELVAKNLATSRTLESRTRELSVLMDMGLSAPQDDQLLGMLKQMLRASLQLTGFRSACFFLLDPRADELRLRVAHHLEPREMPRPVRALRDAPPDLEALLDGRCEMVRNDSAWQADWLPPDAALGLCLPVQADSGPLGTLWLFDRRQREPNEREQHILDSLCSQIALILERVVSRHENTTQQRLRQDLHRLAEARRGEAPIRILHGRGLEVAWRSSSRFEIGGDLCEALSLSDQGMAVIVGDATGDGLTAALTMTAAHGAIEALLAGSRMATQRTDDVLTQVNHAVVRTCRLQHFMSLLVGTLDTGSMTLTYSNAGHPSPLLVRGTEVIPLDQRGLLLGVVEDAEYSEATVSLQPNDILVLFSDGITEARNPHRDFFGSEGILKALAANRSAEVDAATLVRQIWSRLESFAAPGEADDRSLMAIVVPR